MSEWLLVAAVFGFIMALAWAAFALFGGGPGKRLRSRLDALAENEEVEQAASAIRARYLRQLSPVERTLEQLPGMERFGLLTEQAGWTIPAYRMVLTTLGFALAGALVAGLAMRSAPAALIGAVLAGALPWLKLRRDRGKRIDLFEEQLPDALDLMSRSLRAGNPLLESFKFVSEEMKPPIAAEFGRAWSNINYGVSLKVSLKDFMERTPSVSLRSLATAILVQRETGGNLAEILDKITHVLRARARFRRKLRSLTAEGKMSGWILGSLPVGLAIMLSISAPDYLPMLINDDTGRKLIWGSLFMMALGAFWISRIIKIRV